MRRIFSAAAVVLLVVVIAVGVMSGPRSQARTPSLVGSWRVTVDGGQPDYLLVLTADGAAIATDTDVVPFIGAWKVVEGEASITLERLSDPGGGGAQGSTTTGPVTALDHGRVEIGDGFVLSPITA